jgi:beta-N-acetylhexosaminidase
MFRLIMSKVHRTFEARNLLRNVILVALLVYLLVGCGGISIEGRSAKSKNQDPAEDRANKEASMVPRMSVGDMVGQMFVVSVAGTQPDYYIEKMVRERNIGGVILFAYNMESEEQVESLTGRLQGLSMQKEPAVPLFVAVDQEGGDIASAPWVAPQPAAAEVGSHGDPEEAHDIAATMGRQLLRAGINTNFAPVVDTGFGAAIGNRSYGEDPELVARLGVAAVEGFESAGVISAAKHFPNHGPATTDSHAGLPVIRHDAKTLESHDLPPFEAAVEAGVPMVMVGHLLYPAIDPHNPASLSRDAIGVLRRDLGFDGVIVTDDLAMAGAKGSGTPAEAAVEAVQAGADLLILSSPPQQQAEAYGAVMDAVESGKIPRSRIEKSVERLLTVKEGYHLREAGRH